MGKQSNTIKRETYDMSNNSRLRQIGHQVRLRRNVLGLTREELAERTGYSEASIRKIEQGSIDLAVSKLFLLAEALDTNITYLLKLQELPSAGGMILLDYGNEYGDEAADLNTIKEALAPIYEKLYRRCSELMRKESAVLCGPRKPKSRHNEIMKEERLREANRGLFRDPFVKGGGLEI